MEHKQNLRILTLLAMLVLMTPLLAACGASPAATSTTVSQAQPTEAVAVATTSPTETVQAPIDIAGTAALTPGPGNLTGGEATEVAEPEATTAAFTPPKKAEPTLTPAPNAVVLNYWDMQWGGPEFMNQLQNNVTEFNRTHPNI